MTNTTVIDKGKEKPFDVWYRDEKRRLRIKVACANTAAELQDVEKQLREFRTFSGFILDTRGRGRRVIETAEGKMEMMEA